MPRDVQLLFDRAATPGITADHFEPEWLQRQQLVVDTAKGRGTVYFFRAGPAVWVLRRYRRGGWMGRVNRDAYWWQGLEQTRPWREWRLLAELRAKGLPVPRPIAARVTRSGLVYHGDLITERIEGATPLGALLAAGALPREEWGKVGALLARFQAEGVRHDDINVSNVLRDGRGAYHLIDFDKALIAPPGAWQERNLARFRRSIEKLQRRQPAVGFTAADWAAVRAGYQTGAAAGGR
ncbi:3-deoxy-D-manno-octulosonic acid kinase [Lacunisphaera limnophila]|uniref:3-deoxy-D-manno-octulosonic acid kinase n=1 Tax=Lacunisphaera limnophila TaxID=1838286 RepID=A0A1D8AVG9_9BACT|nr:3-deoxy-D-manno-octulosonic acid kinase [Lacunisphaera limnophila]AOS44855.1 3-deoxy-D-manno-octulosonic acid kinase [Lacunisphaera limnophila]